MVDEEGFYLIVGRKKDMLIVGGFNVYPPEVESFYIEHPAILDISVVGVPDPDSGEVPAAAIHVTPGQSLTPQDVVDHGYGTIASAKVPRYVALGHDLPYSGRGKVQKFILKEQLLKLIEANKLERLVPTEVKEKKAKGAKGTKAKGSGKGKAQKK
jgi:fatty-acyl-CoA synthase